MRSEGGRDSARVKYAGHPSPLLSLVLFHCALCLAALRDFRKALEIDPLNVRIQKDMQRAQSRLIVREEPLILESNRED